MLPEYCLSGRVDSEYNCWLFDNMCLRNIKYYNDSRTLTEADARAKMLIYLIKNNLTKKHFEGLQRRVTMTKEEILKELKYLHKLCPQIKDCSLKCIGAKCKDDTCPLCEIEELIQKLDQYTTEVDVGEIEKILITNGLNINWAKETAKAIAFHINKGRKPRKLDTEEFMKSIQPCDEGENFKSCDKKGFCLGVDIESECNLWGDWYSLRKMLLRYEKKKKALRSAKERIESKEI